MRSLLLSLLLVGPAVLAAEWTELPRPASSGAVVYQEPATERYSHNAFVGLFVANPRQAWFLTDYAVPHRWMLYEVRSAKQWLAFDCKHASMRVLARRYYDGAMAQGRLVASETQAPGFSPVVPGEPEEAMYHAACAYEQPQQAGAAMQPVSSP